MGASADKVIMREPADFQVVVDIVEAHVFEIACRHVFLPVIVIATYALRIQKPAIAAAAGAHGSLARIGSRHRPVSPRSRW
jgi:hypothetical protein